jgi:hypothetical protein
LVYDTAKRKFEGQHLRLQRKPAEVVRKQENLTQLTIQVHHRTNEATLKVILPATPTPEISALGTTITNSAPGGGGNPQGPHCAHPARAPRGNRKDAHRRAVCILYVPPVRVELTLDGF